MEEPPHIHVSTVDGECKFWLDPIILARNRGIHQEQLREIERLVFEHHKVFLEKFNEYRGR